MREGEDDGKKTDARVCVVMQWDVIGWYAE
jgi:hypothetical protein